MAKIVKGKEIRKKAGTKVAPARKHVDVIAEGGGVLDHRVISASEKAKKIIAGAEAEAVRIKKEAEAIKKEIIEAREQGRKEGFTKGESEGKASVTEKLTQLQTLREDFYSQAEPEIIKLVLAVAEKVIGQIATERQDVVRDVVRQALERSLGDRVVIRLNPKDYKTVMDEGYEFRDVLDRTKRIMFKEDEAISKGGCIVETEVGTIDAQLETQLDAIRKALEIQ
jgi:flagellar assembly protein FliH